MENLIEFEHHFPRYEELPDLDIYMDQVLQLLNRYFEPIIEQTKENVLTKTMINNYVKAGIIAPPIKKKYSREHLAHLIVIYILKQVYSMEEIAALIQFQLHSYPIERAYNYFCNEFEACIRAIFQGQPLKHVPSHDDDSFEVEMIQSAILSVAYKVYILNSLPEIKKRIQE